MPLQIMSLFWVWLSLENVEDMAGVSTEFSFDSVILEHFKHPVSFKRIIAATDILNFTDLNSNTSMTLVFHMALM